MTQDQFEPDLQQDLSAESGDNFDLGPPLPPKRPSRLPFILTLLVAIAGTVIAVYQIFLGGGKSRPIEVAPPVAAPVDQAQQTTDTSNAGMNVSQMVDQAQPTQNPAAAPEATTSTDTQVSALPAPAMPPNAPEETPTTPAPATAEQTPPVTAPVETATPEPTPVPDAATPPVETAAAPAPAAVTPPVTPPAAAETPVAAAAPATPAVEATPALPAPATEQLTPIETKAPITADAHTTHHKAHAVHAILASEEKSDKVKKAQEQAIMEPAEVTPRAKQVIIVKKSYSAQSGQAINAAGDRVLAAGQYNDAAAMYDRQIKNNPSDILALAGRALALQKAGRTDEAIKVYDRLLQLNPRDVGALTNSLGLLQQQDPQKSLGRLQALSQQYPENAAVAGQLAMAQARLMDTPNALRSFQKAMALDPTSPVYPFNIAVLYDRLGTADKARESYRRALDVANAYPDRAGEVPLDLARERLRAAN